MPYLFIQELVAARATLTTLIGGFLSLTVFSFTMVMAVLNQASTNFLTRLLPGLISNKSHQVILGIYIGTLLYCVIVLISLGANVHEVPPIGFSSMFAALLGVVCLGLFVYFIHSISTAIQIHNIMDRIFKSSRKNLERELEEQQSESKIALHTKQSIDFKTITARQTGYYKGFDRLLLKKSLKEKENQIEVIPFWAN